MKFRLFFYTSSMLLFLFINNEIYYLLGLRINMVKLFNNNLNSINFEAILIILSMTLIIINKKLKHQYDCLLK